MVATAKVISTDSPADVAGLFDTVTIRYPEDGDTETCDDAQDARAHQQGMGKAVMGRKVGEQAWVDAETGRYCVEIVSIEKGKDDESLPILFEGRARGGLRTWPRALLIRKFHPAAVGARSVIMGKTGGNHERKFFGAGRFERAQGAISALRTCRTRAALFDAPSAGAPWWGQNSFICLGRRSGRASIC